MNGNCIAEPTTLAEWQKILEELGFKHEYYNYLDCELIGVDWFKGREHIVTGTCHSKEYNEYLRKLPEGTEFETDWNQCLVTDITIYTDEFAYPEVYQRAFDDWEGSINLSDITMYKNFNSLTLDYFRKALWMSRHPIQAKNEIIKSFINECDIFFSKHGEVMTKLGYKEQSNNILQVGGTVFETEPFISFIHRNAYNIGEESFHYNMFTGKLIYVKSVLKESKWKGVDYYQFNVNEMTPDELETELRNNLTSLNIKID